MALLVLQQDKCVGDAVEDRRHALVQAAELISELCG
jgi:hypothetical protein